MKNLQALAGFKHLSKKEQQNVKGGSPYQPSACRMEDGVGYCFSGEHCENGTCVPDNSSNGGSGNNHSGPEGDMDIQSNQ